MFPDPGLAKLHSSAGPPSSLRTYLAALVPATQKIQQTWKAGSEHAWRWYGVLFLTDALPASLLSEMLTLASLT